MLHDVAIISDTLVYAGGEVRLRDSAGQIDPRPYSVAILNGSRWRFNQLFHDGNNLIVAVRGILPITDNNVWLAAGSVFHWDGISQQTQLRFSRLTFPDPNATIEKLWSATTSNIFGVGYAGAIVRYDGASWQPMTSGTTVPLTDLWGSPDGRYVWACGYKSDLSQSVFLEYHNGVWRTVRETFTNITPVRLDTLSGLMKSVWSVSGKDAEVATTWGMYRVKPRSIGAAVRTWTPPGQFGFLTRVRGTSRNDIFVVGHAGTIVHFNGSTWYMYPEFFSTSTSLVLLSVACSDRLVVAVGYTGGRAIAIIGRR